MLPATQTYSLLPSAIEIELVIKFSNIIANTNFCPLRFRKKPDDTFAAIMMGLEIGLKPMQSIQDIAVINDRPSVYGDAALALIKSSGELEYIDEKMEGDLKTNPIAICIAKRKGEKNEVIQTFSLADSERAGLLIKDTYKKYPLRMLQMRARSWCLRDAFPHILKGIQIREEVEDYPIEKEVTPINKHNSLIEELQQQLKVDVEPIAIETKQPSVVLAINDKIKSAENQEDLNKLTEEIKNGNYSEEEKNKLRKLFKNKKQEISEEKLGKSDVAINSLDTIRNTLKKDI